MDYLEMNASIYCISAKVAINKQKSVIDNIQIIANNMRRQNQHLASYDVMISHIVDWAKEDIINEGWSLTEVNGISWFIAIYAKAYSMIKPEYSFDKIFKDIFKQYYKQTPFNI